MPPVKAPPQQPSWPPGRPGQRGRQPEQRPTGQRPRRPAKWSAGRRGRRRGGRTASAALPAQPRQARHIELCGAVLLSDPSRLSSSPAAEFMTRERDVVWERFAPGHRCQPPRIPAPSAPASSPARAQRREGRGRPWPPPASAGRASARSGMLPRPPLYYGGMDEGSGRRASSMLGARGALIFRAVPSSYGPSQQRRLLCIDLLHTRSETVELWVARPARAPPLLPTSLPQTSLHHRLSLINEW